MIYKFEDCREHAKCILEIQLTTDNKQVVFELEDCQQFLGHISLTKKDVYHLIGALHFLHKEMK